MERLVIKVGGVWHRVEVMQWMERNTRLFAQGPQGEFTYQSTSTYHSQCMIAEIIGEKVIRG